jgi:enterochelin esterase-like enzyme
MRLWFIFIPAFALSGAPLSLSPRIGALKTTVASAGAKAAEAFWDEITAHGGTPLVECPSALAPDCLVTFLWRGDATTRNVVVLAEAIPGEAAAHQFERLAGTDVWYRTYRFRDDARFMYLLSINDPLTTWDVEGPERSKRYAGVRTDPRNPRDACYISLPRAPSEEWVQQRSGVPGGKITAHKVKSAALAGDRTVEVYATPGVQSAGGTTTVLILFDGEEAKVTSRIPVILDNLFAARRIPPMLAVFVHQPYEHRERDLSCSDDMNRFLVEELLPWLRTQYNIRTDPERTIAAGASLGSLASAYAALQHPEAFRRVLSQSGAFWWGKTGDAHEWLTEQFAARPRVPVRFYLDVGLMETGGGATSQLVTNRHMLAVLRGKGYPVTYREFNGPHAYPCWRAGFADALLALLAE